MKSRTRGLVITVLAVLAVVIIGAATTFGVDRQQLAPTGKEIGVSTTIPTLTPEPSPGPPDTRRPVYDTPDAAAQAYFSQAIADANNFPEILQLNDPTDLQRATLGKPYKVYGLSEAKRRADSDAKAMATLLVEGQDWIYPILVDEQPVGEMDVGFRNGSWEMLGLHSLQNSPALLYLQKALGDQAQELKLVGSFEARAVFAIYRAGNEERTIVIDAIGGELKTLDMLYRPGTAIIDDSKPIKSYTTAEILPMIDAFIRADEQTRQPLPTTEVAKP
jgi:hypothetical protein